MPNYVVAATFTLVVGLVGQSAVLSLYLWVRDRAVLAEIVRHWRPSLVAGFMGALASQFWFLAFALATAASVRTLALVEVLFAQAISHFIFKQADQPARGARDRADRARGGAAAVGLLKARPAFLDDEPSESPGLGPSTRLDRYPGPARSKH